MNNAILDTTILKPTRSCVVRQQEQQYLIYNSRTDELHLIQPTGFYVYQLCESLHTVNEIEELLAEVTAANRDAVQAGLREFLDRLMKRGILEVEGNNE